MTDPVLLTVVFLLGGYAALMVALFEMALIRGRKRRRQMEKTARIMPRIHETLVAYLAGNSDLDRFREFQKSSAEELCAAILGYRHAVAGSARDRLCGLTMELGLVHQWREDVLLGDPLRRRAAYAALAFVSAYEPCRRVTGVILADALDHPDREVRLIAAQAVALFGDPAAIARGFAIATRETLLGRILLAEPLRTHAIELCRDALPEALDSKDPVRILGALEIVVGWERALPLPGLEVHFTHERKAIQIAALRAAPLVISSSELEAEVTRCLADPDVDVAMAAAAAVARLRIQSALPLLARCLRIGDAPLARTAAAALASLPPQGWQTLRDVAACAEPVAASAATEALGRVPAAGAA
jgi:hypothetical protein